MHLIHLIHLVKRVSSCYPLIMAAINIRSVTSFFPSFVTKTESSFSCHREKPPPRIVTRIVMNDNGV